MLLFILIATVVYLTLASYFCWRLIFPLKLARGVKVSLISLAVLVMMHEFIFRAIELHVSDGVAGVLAWFLLTMVLSVLMFLVLDMVRLLLRVFGKNSALLGLPSAVLCYALACILSSYGMYEALKVPTVKHVTLHYKNLPEDLEGVKIAHLTDLHVGRFFREEWLDESLCRILAQQPDIILITGDAIDAPIATAATDARPYERLSAPLGVYFVAGNHEYIQEYKPWMEYFRAMENITLLENANKRITRGSSALEIVGITDVMAQRGDLPAPSAELAMRGLPAHTENRFRILLSHRPGEPEAAKVRADLQLSGHTHGGTLVPIMPIVAKSNGGFVSGLYELAYGKLYVSNGMGIWTGMPMRLGVPSEMSIITLERE